MKSKILTDLSKTITTLLTKIQTKENEEEKKYEIKFSPPLRQTITALGPLLLAVNLGMVSGYSAVMLPQLQKDKIKITQTEASWIASIAVLPMTFGCFLGGFLMEKIGRKMLHLLTSIPCLIGWLLIYFSIGIETILVGRFLTGLCGGLLGPCTGVYISETSHPKYRGFLLATISSAVATGLFFVHILGTWLNWRDAALISCILPIVSFLILLFVPESPAWLAKNGNLKKAEFEFYWFRGFNDDSQLEFEAIKQKTAAQKDETSSVLKKDALFKYEFLKPLGIIVTFSVVNQWSGINAVTFYTISIMKQILNDDLNEYLAMLLVDFIRLFMSIVACIFLKKMSRRNLAFTSGCGTFISLFILSLYSFVIKNVANNTSKFTFIPMSALITYISFITIGFVPLPWAMMSEVFPLNSRNIGSSISAFMAFAAFFSVVKTSPAMFETLGSDGTFLIYGAVALGGTIFVKLYLPETKDKALHEIEEDLKIQPNQNESSEA